MYIDLKKKKQNLSNPLFPKKLLPEANSDGKFLKNVNQNVDSDIIEWFGDWYPNYTAQTNMKPTQNTRKTFSNRYAH